MLMVNSNRDKEMKQPANVVNLSLAYLSALLFAGLLLTVPGGRVIIYVAIGMACVLLGLCRSRAVRIWSVAATIITLVLIGWDHERGLRFQEALYRTVAGSVDERRSSVKE
jgi:hypothetical protein